LRVIKLFSGPSIESIFLTYCEITLSMSTDGTYMFLKSFSDNTSGAPASRLWFVTTQDILKVTILSAFDE